MEETTKKRHRTPHTFQYKKNAVNVTVYDATGATIPVEIRDEIEKAVCDIALEHRYFINIATE